MSTILIANAPNYDRKQALKGLSDPFCQEDFEKDVKKRNPDGSISEGIISMCFSAPASIKTCTEAETVAGILKRSTDLKKPLSKEYAKYGAKTLHTAVPIMKKGIIVHIRKGVNVFLIVVLTSDYYFRLVDGMPLHSWDYRVIEHVSYKYAVRKTFCKNATKLKHVDPALMML